MSTSGGGGYYPQEPYFAPGWSAPQPGTEPPRRNRRALVLVLVLTGVAVLGLVAWAVITFVTSARTSTLGEVTDPTQVHARRLDVGHCVETLPQDGRVARVDVVPCEDPHVAEVVGAHPFRSDAWPGRSTVEAEATAACEMDTAQRDAGFRAVVWTPSEASWGQGDRRGLCLAWLDEGQARGSFAAGDEVTTG